MSYSPTRAMAPPVSAQTQAIAYREIATVLRTGIPIHHALEQAAHTGPHHFRSALRDLGQHAANGNPVSGRMREYGALFHPVVPAMVAAGEQTGMLEDSFSTLAEFFEAEAEVKRIVTNASIYPACVVITAIAVVAILATVPGMIMARQGMEPMNFMSLAWARGLGIAVLLIIAAIFMQRFRWFSELTRRLTMMVPFFGNIIRNLSVARFCQTLGLLIRAGVPYLEALETTQPTIRHPWVEQAANHVYANVRNGNTLEDSFRRQMAFPAIVRNLVGAGEAAGSVDDSLIRAATFLRNDASHRIRNSAKLLGPVMIILLGIIVAFIIGSFLRGYFEMIFSLAE